MLMLLIGDSYFPDFQKFKGSKLHEIEAISKIVGDLASMGGRGVRNPSLHTNHVARTHNIEIIERVIEL